MRALRLHAPDLDPAEAAFAALDLAVGAFEGAPPRLVWRTDAFARLMPGLSPGDPAPPGLNVALEAAERGETAPLSLDGDEAVLEVRPGKSAGGRLYLKLSDAAERQEAEARRLADRERLLLTSRVMSVGEMATMIAHELNQPIGSIANIVRGLKARLSRDALTVADGVEALDKAADQALYASGVIQRMRSFVEQRQPMVEPLDLPRLARATLDLLDWEIARDRVSAQAVFDEDLPPVLGDAVMIQQVLVNLARNGLDAMRGEPQPRRLAIAGRRLEGSTRMVELTVTDTGPGVSEDAAGRMFSPFFSTKPGGMGVGLGICRSIIELHRGRLWHTRDMQAAKALGGSVFHIALPTARQEDEP
jgi:two-component system sensor kinase FixL